MDHALRNVILGIFVLVIAIGVIALWVVG